VASNKHPLGALLALNHDIASGRPPSTGGASPPTRVKAKAKAVVDDGTNDEVTEVKMDVDGG